MFKKSRNTETGRFDLIALGQRTAANTLGGVRLAAGVLGSEYIAEHPHDYRSLGTAAVIGGIAAGTDFADGRLARRAARRLRGLTTKAGQWIDQLTDKFMAHSILGTIALQEIVNGNRTYGLALAAVEIPVFMRDVYATNLRARQPEGIEIKARQSGKTKAAIGMAVMTAAVSPLAESMAGEVGIIVGGAVFAVTSVSSALELRSSMTTQQEVMSTQNFSASEAA